MKTEFEKELENLINRYSKENDSDTPDFILARYLNAALNNFNAAIKEREQWYGREVHYDDHQQLKLFDFDAQSIIDRYINNDKND